MDEYPKHIIIDGVTFTATSADHEAELRGGGRPFVPPVDVTEMPPPSVVLDQSSAKGGKKK